MTWAEPAARGLIESTDALYQTFSRVAGMDVVEQAAALDELTVKGMTPAEVKKEFRKFQNLLADLGAADAKVKGRIDPTEDGVALAFTELHRDGWRFDHDAGRWFGFDGNRWAANGREGAFAFCRDLAREASVFAGNGAKSVLRASFAAGVERMARSDPAHAVTHEAWDRDPWLLGCPGVTVDLRDGTCRRPDPADGLTKLAAVAPAGTADCPRWLAFVAEATGGDEATIRFLRQWCGYCLTGDTREHALFFIYGPGGNGKSVFLNTLTGVLADYAETAVMDVFATSAHEKHSTDLAMLRGARLVSVSETGEGRAWAETRVKQLTGGDKVTARFMRQDNFTFTPRFKIIIVGNHTPVLRNVDEAMRRRVNIIPFDQTPACPDPELEAKLKAEWPGILRWMLDGCADWREHGLTRPPSVLDATAGYFASQDVFGQWLEDECLVEPSNRHRYETTGDLFAAWSAYSKAAGEEPGTANRFSENMQRRGFERTSKKVGKTVRVWLGITMQRNATHEL